MHRSFDAGVPCYPLAPRSLSRPHSTSTPSKSSSTNSSSSNSSSTSPKPRRALDLGRPSSSNNECWRHEISLAIVQRAMDDEESCFACECEDVFAEIARQVPLCSLDVPTAACTAVFTAAAASTSISTGTHMSAEASTSTRATGIGARMTGRARSNAILPVLAPTSATRFSVVACANHPAPLRALCDCCNHATTAAAPQPTRLQQFHAFCDKVRRQRGGKHTNAEVLDWLHETMPAQKGFKKKYRTRSMPSDWSSPVDSVSFLDLEEDGDGGLCGVCGRRKYGFCVCERVV